MKTMCYLFSVIMSLLFLSCSTENDDYSALYFKTLLTNNQKGAVLKSSVSGEDSLFIGNVEPLKETVIEFCTGKDLDWYNETTSELKFKDLATKDTLILNFYVYLDVEFLFGLNLIPNVMSYVVNVPVLEQDLQDGSRYYIAKGYPNWDLNNYDKDNAMRIEREKNWNALVQSDGWKLFIMQLKKEGKYKELISY